MGSDMNINLQG